MHLDFKTNLCTGCSACANICPKQCISMQRDNEGFLYPHIDLEKCIDCSMCDTHCHILNWKESDNYVEPDVYAAWSLDENIRYESTSGGIFTEIAQKVIERGGIVIGARYDEKSLIIHGTATEKKELSLLRQSKYAQSDKKKIFNQIKLWLKDGKTVMFCGAPCECAGLKTFLGEKNENLILLDFICLGVNSPTVYGAYRSFLEKKYGSKIYRMWFKNKKYGWNRFSTYVEFQNGEKYWWDRYNDLFMRGYLEQRLFLRPSCYECKYKGLPRVADISLGDFWGIGDYKKELDTNKGTSLVLINTEKGKALFDLIGNSIYYEKVPFQVALKNNPAIMNSAIKNEKRPEFFVDVNNMKFDKLIYKYCGRAYSMNVKRKIRSILSRIKKAFYILDWF